MSSLLKNHQPTHQFKEINMKKANLIKSTLSGLVCLAGVSMASGQIVYDQSTFWAQEHIQKGLLRMWEVDPLTEPKLTEDEQLVVKQAIELMELNNDASTEEARILIEKSITDKSSALLHFFVGNIYAQKADSENALLWYDQALKAFPNFLKVQRNVGIMRATSGDFEKALPSLIKAVELGATDNTTYGLIGLCYVSTGKFVSAESAYRQATVMDPAIKDWQLGLARSLILQGKHTEAIAVLEELLTTDPENDIIWAQQGSSYVALDDIETAVANFEVVERLGKATPVILELMGQIYMDRGLHELAVNSFKKAIAKDEGRPVKTYIDIADLMVAFGALDGAKSYIGDIRSRFGSTLTKEHESRLLRMESQIALSTGDDATYVPILERLIENDPLDGQTLLMLAEHHSGQDTIDGYARADIYYERAAKVAEYEVTALIAQAGSYVARELYGKAIPLLERAQTLEPKEHIGRYLDQVRRINAANLGL